jgi:hypothetical protein
MVAENGPKVKQGKGFHPSAVIGFPSLEELRTAPPQAYTKTRHLIDSAVGDVAITASSATSVAAGRYSRNRS